MNECIDISMSKTDANHYLRIKSQANKFFACQKDSLAI